MKPFKTSPFFVPKIWGGRLLETAFKKVLPTEELYGESWEVADLPEGQSSVATGPDAGKTLREMVEIYRDDLVGPGHDQFPLLVKILDAAADLSVQVHPGEKDLHSHPGARLKDECWIFLKGDGVIYHGVTDSSDAETFHAALKNGTTVEQLRELSPKVGDAIRVAPGTVHAIGSGVALLEIQTPSDTTFRVWDYERVGLDGNPRALHVSEALEVMTFKNDDSLVPVVDGVIFRTPHYHVEKVCGGGKVPGDGFARVVSNVYDAVLMVGELEVRPFETAIVPAASQGVTFRGEAIVSWAIDPT